jgi:hypothetical protein
VRIDFFEEYPDAENLAPAALLAAPATIYLAAPSLAGFRAAAARLAGVNAELEPAWWPVLPRSYWISPFAAADELERLRLTLIGAPPLTVLLDLELPWVRPHRLALGLLGFRRGRRAVRRLIDEASLAGHRVVTAEYPPAGPLTARAWELLGVAYPGAAPHLRLPMCYSSLIPTRALRRRLRAGVVGLARRHPGRVGVGLGTIGRGALQREPLLSPQGLARDLERFADTGVVNATVFRLGGLDERYAEVLRRHAANWPKRPQRRAAGS